MSPKSDFVVSPKPFSESRYEFPASVLNVDGSLCMLIPPGSYSPLKQLVTACGLSDEPSSYPILVAALIQCGHALVCSEPEHSECSGECLPMNSDSCGDCLGTCDDCLKEDECLCAKDGVKECPCVDCTSQDLLPP